MAFLFATTGFAGTGLSFLEIPVGARENALGGAGVALVSGPASVTFNPAAAALMPRSAALMHNRHFADTRAQFVGVTFRRGRFAVTPHYRGTRVADIEYRTYATREPVSTFDAVNSAVGAAAALRCGNNFAVGITGHYLYQKIHVESADGWAIDAGVMVRELAPGLTLGATAQHMGRMNEFAFESPTLPTTLRAGAAFERAVSNYGSVLVTAEGNAVRENTPVFRGGIEYRAPDYLALRAGIVEGLAAQALSLGLGFFVGPYRLDYAFIPFRENLGDGHRFALTFGI